MLSCAHTGASSPMHRLDAVFEWWLVSAALMGHELPSRKCLLGCDWKPLSRLTSTCFLLYVCRLCWLCDCDSLYGSGPDLILRIPGGTPLGQTSSPFLLLFVWIMLASFPLSVLALYISFLSLSLLCKYLSFLWLWNSCQCVLCWIIGAELRKNEFIFLSLIVNTLSMRFVLELPRKPTRSDWVVKQFCIGCPVQCPGMFRRCPL